MHRFRNLAVGLSRTNTDADVLRYAAVVSGLGTIESVRFVHVLAPSGDPPAPASHDELQSELKQSVAAYFAAAAPARISYDILTGPLTDRMLTCVAEQHADLVMVGQGHATAGRRALARRLAMKAPCSVWMVPEGSAASIERLLVPIDFSDHSQDTLRVAVSLARLSGAVCVPLHVYFNEAVATYEEYDQVLRGEEEAAYRRFVAPINCGGVEMTPRFEEGANVAHVIGRVAERVGADLIVMGTRGRSRSAAILLGSVTEEAILQARTPLLAVKHFGARMSVLQALLDRRFLYRGAPHTD